MIKLIKMYDSSDSDKNYFYYALVQDNHRTSCGSYARTLSRALEYWGVHYLDLFKYNLDNDPDYVEYDIILEINCECNIDTIRSIILEKIPEEVL